MTSDNRSPADDGLSVAPPDPTDAAGSPPSPVGRADAGTDTSIEERLQRNPQSEQARIDRGSDESMDASDPIAAVQPGGNEPAPSSGYNEEEEQKLIEGQGS